MDCQTNNKFTNYVKIIIFKSKLLARSYNFMYVMRATFGETISVPKRAWKFWYCYETVLLIVFFMYF